MRLCAWMKEAQVDFSGCIFVGPERPKEVSEDVNDATTPPVQLIEIDGTSLDMRSFRFPGVTRFDGARTKFTCFTFFDGANFEGGVCFDGAAFSDSVVFDSVTFQDKAKASFEKISFLRGASFHETEFLGDTSFGQAHFSDFASFMDTKFFGKR